MSSSHCTCDGGPLEPPASLPPLTRADRIRLLSLRQRSKIDKLRSSIPIPRRAVPPNAPPAWHQLPLDRILPQLPSYDDDPTPICYSRQKIGQRILYNTAGTDFDPSAIHGQRIFIDYEPLHDCNLRRKLTHPDYLHRFRQLGLLAGNEQLDVVCSLAQFNAFRAYLNALHGKRVDRLCAQVEQDARDVRNFRHAELRIAQQHARGANQSSVVANLVELARHRHRHLRKLRQRIAAKDAALQHFRHVSAAANWARCERHRIGRDAFLQRWQRLLELDAARRQRLRQQLRLQSTLVEQRLRARSEHEHHERNARIRQQLTARVPIVAERLAQDDALLELAARHTMAAMQRRQRQVAAAGERDNHRTAMLRVQQIRGRYESSEREYLVRKMCAGIRQFVRRERERDSDNGGLRLSADEYTFAGYAEWCAADDDGDEEGEARPPRMLDAATSAHFPDHTVAQMGNREPIEATIPYEPHAETSVGLTDEVGTGYGRLKDEDIRRCVGTTYDAMQVMGEPINSRLVLERANTMLMRICAGYVNDVPNDEPVVDTVKSKVRVMIERVLRHPLEAVEAVLQMRWRNEKEAEAAEAAKAEAAANKKRAQASTEIYVGAGSDIRVSIANQESDNDSNVGDIVVPVAPAKRQRTELALTFGPTTVVNTSAYADRIGAVRSARDRKPTAHPSVRTQIQLLLRSSADEMNGAGGGEPLAPLPPAMLGASMEHLYDYQKRIIISNLDRFEATVGELIDHQLQRYFDFAKLTDVLVGGKRRRMRETELTPGERADMYDTVTASVLTLPEKDVLFAERAVKVAALLAPDILRAIRDLMVVENERRQRMLANNAAE